MNQPKGLQMRYIMILSLCLVGFQGYAATEEPMDVDPSRPLPILVDRFPAEMEVPKFRDILDRGSVTDGKKTWEVISIYPHTPSISRKIFTHVPIDSAEPKLTKEEALDRLKDYALPGTLYGTVNTNQPDGKSIFYLVTVNPFAPPENLYVIFDRVYPAA